MLHVRTDVDSKETTAGVQSWCVWVCASVPLWACCWHHKPLNQCLKHQATLWCFVVVVVVFNIKYCRQRLKGFFCGLNYTTWLVNLTLWLLHRNTPRAGPLQYPMVRGKHLPVNKCSLYQQSSMCKVLNKKTTPPVQADWCNPMVPEQDFSAWTHGKLTMSCVPRSPKMWNEPILAISNQVKAA